MGNVLSEPNNARQRVNAFKWRTPQKDGNAKQTQQQAGDDIPKKQRRNWYIITKIKS